MSAGSDSVAGVLERAADRLSKPGEWRQSARPGNSCTVEAIAEVGGGMREVAHLRAFLGVHSISAWNDAPERTQAEVVEKLREAATKARSPQ